MKKLILTLLLFPAFAFAQKKKPVKERHFFIGYIINTGRQSATGNIQWHTYDGLMPIKNELFKFLIKEYTELGEFTFDQLSIIGLFEFKSKKECDQFFNLHKIKA
jgi:hypothetical protein